MTPFEFDRFNQALAAAAAGYLVKLTPDQVAAYWQQLQAFDLPAVEAALAQAPRQHPTFFPKAGELLALIEGSSQDRAAVAWRTLVGLCQVEGAYPSLQVTDGGLAYAIKQGGGWIEYQRRLSSASVEMERAHQKNFEALYRVGHARGVAAQYFIGTDEAANRDTDPPMRRGADGHLRPATEIPVKVCLVAVDRYVALKLPLDLRTRQLAAAAREALTAGGEAIRRYLPAPPPKLLAGTPADDDERATPEEIAQLNDAIAGLSGRRVMRGRLLGAAPEPTETDTVQ